jgi:hypothetical protein
VHSKSIPATLILVTTSFFLASCSSGPKGPQPGTPGFYWAAARETFTQGDFLKTVDNLDRAMKGAEFAARARPFSLVLTSGLVRGYMDLADNFELGAKASRTNAAAFRRQVMDMRRYARAMSLQFAENFRAYEKSEPTGEIPLAFPFPSGSPAEPPAMAKVVQGIMPQPADLDVLQRAMLARAVIMQTALVTGSGDDSVKAQEMFKAGEVKVPRHVFMLGMAQALHDEAQLYGPKKLAEPDKMRIFAEEAIDAIKGVPDSKEAKSLNEKLQKVLKEAKKSA